MNVKNSKLSPERASAIFRILTAVVIAKVTFSVILNNRQYFPPDFRSDFLLGRQAYFYGVYQYAFFTHVVAGPISLMLGLVLVSKWFRAQWPVAHRWIGRTQVTLVVFVVAPGGFLMALRAVGGHVAVWGFAVLAILTAATALMGYVSARQRKFVQHERWMFRCFLLLVSAVVLRLMAGLATVAGIDGDWLYPTSAWTSWLLPLAVYELYWRWSGRSWSAS